MKNAHIFRTGLCSINFDPEGESSIIRTEAVYSQVFGEKCGWRIRNAFERLDQENLQGRRVNNKKNEGIWKKVERKYNNQYQGRAAQAEMVLKRGSCKHWSCFFPLRSSKAELKSLLFFWVRCRARNPFCWVSNSSEMVSGLPGRISRSSNQLRILEAVSSLDTLPETAQDSQLSDSSSPPSQLIQQVLSESFWAQLLALQDISLLILQGILISLLFEYRLKASCRIKTKSGLSSFAKPPKAFQLITFTRFQHPIFHIFLFFATPLYLKIIPLMGLF